MTKGLTLLETLVSLALLTLLILNGMSLYVTSISGTDHSRTELTELWLAKGKLETIAENPQPLQKMADSFPSPFQAYAYHLTRTPLPDEPKLQLLTLEVFGPQQTKIKLERVTPTMP